MSLDYSRWDQIAKEQDEAEKLAKKNESDKRRMEHFREQAEKQKKWKETHPDDHSDHDHKDHDHKHEQGIPNRPRCGCGFMNPEEIQKLQNAPPKEEIPVDIKNEKKKQAILAAKEHGGILFNAGDYAQAVAIYERGLLILNGTYGLSDEQQDEMNTLEALLNLNLCACFLKTNEFKKAVDYANMALKFDPNSVKAVYRKCQGLLGMGDFELAKSECLTGIKKYPQNGDLRKLLDEIKQVDNEKSEIKRKNDMEAQARIAANFAKTNK